MQYTGPDLPGTHKAARETGGNTAQGGAHEVKVKGMQIEGTVNSMECVSKVTNTDLKCPLILAIWEVPNDLANLFH